MGKSSLVLLWFFAMSSFAYAGASPIAAVQVTPSEAQAAVTLATTALEQASAWVSLSRKNLDNANKALAKKPKSATAKQAAKAARQELDSATAYKAKTDAELREKSKIEKTASRNGGKSKTDTTNKVPVYSEEEYNLFAEKYESYEAVERVDAYYFFNDPFESKNKTVILDAKFDGMISPDVAKFTIWRNFGKMPLIVSNIPAGFVIPKDKTMLLVGVITDFKKEVVSDELVLSTLFKLNAIYVCRDRNCNGTGHI